MKNFLSYLKFFFFAYRITVYFKGGSKISFRLTVDHSNDLLKAFKEIALDRDLNIVWTNNRIGGLCINCREMSAMTWRPSIFGI